jgi:hypothetical protein
MSFLFQKLLQRCRRQGLGIIVPLYFIAGCVSEKIRLPLCFYAFRRNGRTEGFAQLNNDFRYGRPFSFCVNMLRFFIRLSILVRTSIKWSNKLLKVPQPKAEKDLQRALTSAVETEFEIEYTPYLKIFFLQREETKKYGARCFADAVVIHNQSNQA